MLWFKTLFGRNLPLLPPIPENRRRQNLFERRRDFCYLNFENKRK
jgi:hypothetical protein